LAKSLDVPGFDARLAKSNCHKKAQQPGERVAELYRVS
jgi:hypothetical protein